MNKILKPAAPVQPKEAESDFKFELKKIDIDDEAEFFDFLESDNE